jgi:predicted transcriptional regulator
MKTVEIKSTLHQKIDSLSSRELNEFYGLFQNYLNGNDDVEEWHNLTVSQQDKIKVSLQEANNGKTKPVSEVTSRLRKKYTAND